MLPMKLRGELFERLSIKTMTQFKFTTLLGG